MTPALLSVVVIGRNEGPRLERCLRSVQAMVLPASMQLELIYVDSASTDESVRVAKSFGAETVILDASRNTAARARNAGYKRSAGSLILFLDGDTILDSSFVVDSLSAFDDKSIGIVCGRRREITPTASVFNRVVDLDWMSPAGLVEFCGGDALVRRSALDEMGGYDATLIAGEEPELCCRMRMRGWKILLLDHAMTGHDIAMYTWAQYWRRATRTGYAYAEVSRRFQGAPITLWKTEARRNRTRAAFLVSAALGMGGSLLVARSWWPILICSIFFMAIVLRTAWKNRWKSSNVLTLLLYGVHSHLQQIPIYIGQLQYVFDVRRGRSRTLIEYKTAR